MLRKIALTVVAVLAFPAAALACSDHQQQAAAEKAPTVLAAKAKKTTKTGKKTTPAPKPAPEKS